MSTKKAAKKTTARRSPAAKKTAAKKTAANGARERYVKPGEDSIREKLLTLLQKHKWNVAEAKAAAVKAQVNKFTATKQLYLMAKNRTNFERDGRAAK
jgi:hypothetical protein